LISATIYASQNAEIDLKNTPETNMFFFLFAVLIPIIFFGILIFGLASLDGDAEVKNFKTFMLAAEAIFGGVFAIMMEGIFGSPKKSKSFSRK